MDTQDRIFRQAALDKLSSPEQLDQLMQVASPKGWLALGALGLVLLTALVWGVFGRVPTRVHGRGILIRPGGVSIVTARGDGAVLRVHASPEQILTNDQVVATVYQPELQLRMEQATNTLQQLQRELQTLRGFQEAERVAEQDELEKQRLNYTNMIADFAIQIGELSNRVEAQKGLLTKGLISEVQLLDTKNNFYLAQRDLARANVQLKQLAVQELQSNERRRQQVSDKTSQIMQSQHQLELLTSLWGVSSQIKTPYAGEVLEIMVKEGQLVSANTPILSLQALTNTLEARLYLSPADGKQVTRAHRVDLSPVSAKKEEYGLLRGEVKQVSPFPETPQGMLRALENSTLVNEFLQGGAPIEVIVTLLTNSAGGLLWTSKAGEEVKLSSGTLCAGTITINRRRPISFVLPLFKKVVSP